MPDNTYKIFKGTILNGGTKSDEIILNAAYYPAMIKFPAITTSTAINFEVMFTTEEGSDGVYTDLYNATGVYSLTITAGTPGIIALDPTVFYSVKRMKVKVANAQTGDKLIEIIGRQY